MGGMSGEYEARFGNSPRLRASIGVGIRGKFRGRTASNRTKMRNLGDTKHRIRRNNYLREAIGDAKKARLEM